MKSKVSKNNIYAIKYLLDQGWQIENIAEEINLSVEAVQKIIDAENITPQKPQIKTAKDLMINETAIKRTKNVSIMTKEASMQLDTKVTNIKNQQSETHIFKPFNK
jgi:orotate phosphoribosyltransferase-like protein